MKIQKIATAAYMLLMIGISANAQSIDKLASLPLDSAIDRLKPVMDGKVSQSVRIFGIGNVSHFAKESVLLNSALAAYLIRHENFRQFILTDNDWLLRPLADYLHGDAPYSESLTDSLFKFSLGNTQYCTAELRSFVRWLKQFNMAHPDDKVKIAGLLPEEPIPASYFLVAYILPIDKETAGRFATSWSDDIYNTGKPWEDIRQWFAGTQANVAVAEKFDDLLSQCGKDLMYNEVVHRRSALRPGSPESVSARMQINAEWILNIATKRTVLFASNEYTARSEAMLSGHRAASYALHLHRKIGKAYFASLTDFSAPVVLGLIHPGNLSMKQVEIPPTRQSADMAAIQSIYSISDNKDKVSTYVPRTIFPIAGQDRPFYPSPTLAPADMIFILPKLTNARLLDVIR